MNQKLLTLLAFNLLVATSSIAMIPGEEPTEKTSKKEESEEELEEFYTPLAAQAAEQLGAVPYSRVASFAGASQEPFLLDQMTPVLLAKIAAALPNWQSFVRFATSCRAFREAASFAIINFFRLRREPVLQEQAQFIHDLSLEYPMQALRIFITDNMQIDSILELLKVRASQLHTVELTFAQAIPLESLQSLLAILTKIPNLTSLGLDLSYNRLEFTGIEALASALLQMSHLQVLHLYINCNLLVDHDISELALALGQLTDLNELDLNISDNRAVYTNSGVILADALARLTKLRSLVLEMRYYRLGDAGIMNMANSLRGLTQLRRLHLDLSHTSVSDDQHERLGRIILAQVLGELTHLRELHLNLRFNPINAAEAQALAQTLGQLIHLQQLHLYLGNTNIENETVGRAELTLALGQLFQLQELHLDLSDNTIENTSIINLALALKQLTQLRRLHLDLSENSAISELPLISLIMQLPHLQKLHLHLKRNLLGNTQAQLLAFALTQLRSVQELNLDLTKNEIGTEGLQSLKRIFKLLPNLKRHRLIIHPPEY